MGGDKDTWSSSKVHPCLQSHVGNNQQKWPRHFINSSRVTAEYLMEDLVWESVEWFFLCGVIESSCHRNWIASDEFCWGTAYLVPLVQHVTCGTDFSIHGQNQLVNATLYCTNTLVYYILWTAYHLCTKQSWERPFKLRTTIGYFISVHAADSHMVCHYEPSCWLRTSKYGLRRSKCVRRTDFGLRPLIHCASS